MSITEQPLQTPTITPGSYCQDLFQQFPIGVALTQALEGGGHGCGVMGEIVDHGDACGLADDLHPSSDAREISDRGNRLVRMDPC